MSANVIQKLDNSVLDSILAASRQKTPKSAVLTAQMREFQALLARQEPEVRRVLLEACLQEKQRRRALLEAFRAGTHTPAHKAPKTPIRQVHRDLEVSYV